MERHEYELWERWKGHILHVVYTQRGDVRWIISARMANKKERRKWHDER